MTEKANSDSIWDLSSQLINSN